MHVLRMVLIGIAIGVAIILGVRFIGKPAGLPPAAANRAAQPAELSAARARTAVEGQIKSNGEYARFFKTVQEQFPADYERMIAGFTDRAIKSSGTQSSDIYVAEALRAMRQSHGILASKASVDMIERVFEQQAKIISTLAQSSPQLCADFLYGNAPPAFYQFSAKNRTLIAAMAEAGLQAILDGRSHRIERAPPADADFVSLETELEKKGLARPEIEALLDGKTPEPPLADTAMCRAGIVYFETLRSLPQDIRIKIYALMIKMLARG